MIFTKGDFAEIDNDPFLVFDQALFIKDAEAFVTQFYQSNVDEKIEFISQSTNDTPLELITWLRESGQVFSAIYSLSQTPDKVALIYGSHEEIENTIRWILRLVHPWERKAFTFDTHASVSSSGGLIIGRPNQDRNCALNIDIKHRAISGKAYKTEPVDIYVRWLLQSVQSQDDLMLLPTFRELGFAFTSRSTPDRRFLSEQTCEIFLKTFQHEVRIGLSTAIARAISQSFADFFLDSYFAFEPSRINLVSVAASQQVNISDLIHVLKDWMMHQGNTLLKVPKQYLDEMWRLVNLTKDPVLAFWLAYLRGDEKARQKELKEMSEVDYIESLLLVNKPIPPSFLFTEQFLSIFIDTISNQAHDIEEDNFFDLVNLLLSHGHSDVLNVLSPRVAKLGNKSLAHL